jgi:hypothetical protein
MISPPFSTDLLTSKTIDPGSQLMVGLSFSPAATGPATQTVVLQSNGGSATLILSGTGVPLAGCTYSVAPPRLQFDQTIVGQTARLAVQFANLGDGNCTVSDIRIDPSSDSSFALASDQATSATVTPTAGSFPITVEFAPQQVGTAFQGSLSFQAGSPATAITIPLSGSAIPQPCTFQIQPSSVTFSNVAIGGSAMQSFQVMATSSATCTISNVALAADSDPSFALVTGQPTSGTATVGASFPVGVIFSPTTLVTNVIGHIQLHVAKPDTDQQVTLSGTALPCSVQIAPTQLNFGLTAPGTSITKTVSLTAGPSPCTISSVTVDPTGDPAFTLAAGQATLGTATATTPFSIAVTFAPTTAGALEISHLLFDTSPPSSPASVVLGGYSSLCPDPESNGSCPFATAPVYVNTWTELDSWDPATNIASLVTDFAPGVNYVSDIAIDGWGNLLAVEAGNGSASLYAVDVHSGAFTFLAGLADSTAAGLTFLADGRLVVAGSGVEILSPPTYTAQTLVPPGTFQTSGDVVGTPDGALYWTVQGGSALSADDLVRIDPSTGATTDLGSLPAQGVYGLSYENGTLYGFTNQGQVMTINPANPAASVVASVPGTWSGAATNPSVWP